MRKSLPFAFVLVFALSGCKTIEPYSRPDVDLPKAWNNAGDVAAKPVPRADRAAWWSQWHDAVLDGLMQAALDGNLDLKAAQAHIDEAKALGDVGNARFKPEIGLSGNGGVDSGLGTQGGINKANGHASLGVNGSLELDTHGVRALQAQAGEAGIALADAQYRQTMNTLLAEVARTYVDIRAKQHLYALVLKNLDLETETLRVIKIQTGAGAGVQLDVLRAQAQVEATRSELPDLTSTLHQDYNRIAVLLGQSPGALDARLGAAADMPVFAGGVALDTPAEIIAGRPDVESAESTLMEAAALKQIRSADLFPRVTLSGFFGIGDSSYFGGSAPATLLGEVTRPLLDYGRIERQIDASEARKQQAFFAYKQTLLLAVEDVENRLIAWQQEQVRFANLQKTADLQREVTRQARLKYQAGDATFLDVLIAEQQLLQAELSATQSQARLTQAGIDLYTALGASLPESRRPDNDL